MAAHTALSASEINWEELSFPGEMDLNEQMVGDLRYYRSC